MMSRLAGWFTSVEPSWLDLIDILIVAFIIYQLLQLIRGTHAVQMALGAMVLVLVYWVSQWADLETVNWLLRTFLPYVVFGIIVVFQAEIRKVLAHLGKTPLLGAFSAQRTEEMIDEVVLAATTLASQHTGAIIVIEREMGLRTFADTGIALDALVSYDLLMNIFTRRSPLHDGAVVISEGRIKAASCYLPLTTNPSLSRTYGTRHRAAIGITEESDALAIVVSEERGVVSLAEGGRISPALDAKGLERALHRALGAGEEAVAATESGAVVATGSRDA